MPPSPPPAPVPLPQPPRLPPVPTAASSAGGPADAPPPPPLAFRLALFVAVAAAGLFVLLGALALVARLRRLLPGAARVSSWMRRRAPLFGKLERVAVGAAAAAAGADDAGGGLPGTSHDPRLDLDAEGIAPMAAAAAKAAVAVESVAEVHGRQGNYVEGEAYLAEPQASTAQLGELDPEWTEQPVIDDGKAVLHCPPTGAVASDDVFDRAAYMPSAVHHGTISRPWNAGYSF